MVPWLSIRVGIRREFSSLRALHFVKIRGYLPSPGHSGAFLKKLRKHGLKAQNQLSFIAETKTQSGGFLKSMSLRDVHGFEWIFSLIRSKSVCMSGALSGQARVGCSTRQTMNINKRQTDNLGNEMENR